MPETVQPNQSIEYWQGNFNKYAALQDQLNKYIFERFGFDLSAKSIYRLTELDYSLKEKIADLEDDISLGTKYYSDPQNEKPDGKSRPPAPEELENQFEQLKDTINKG